MYIIDFIDGTTREAINQYFLENNISLVKEFDSLGLVFSVESVNHPPESQIIERISADTDLTIQPLEATFKSFPLDDEDEHWWKVTTVNIKDFGLESVRHILNVAQINVYIMDSGLKSDHIEFQDVDVENVYTYNGSYNDTHGHGTAIASIVAGNRCSLTRAKLKVVKIFGDTATYQSHMLSALDAIIKDNTVDATPAIVNISWSIPKNQYIESKLQYLINNNILVVCSAGNNGMPIPNVTPASMDDAITVGSYNKDFYPSNFSNYTQPNAIANSEGEVNHGEVDVWAPGEQILVATLDGGYGYVAGTSIAAAIETSVLAYHIGDFYMVENIPDNYLEFVNLKAVFTSTMCSKPDLLVLENQYQNCVNRIANIHSQYSNDSNYQTRFFPLLKHQIFHNKPFKIPLYMGRYSFHRELAQELPEGWTIENGWVGGIAVLNDDEKYRIITIDLTHYSENKEYSAHQHIDIYLKRENYDYSLDPETDPELLIKLAVQPFECSWFYTPVYGNGYCGVTCQSDTIWCVDYDYFCNYFKSYSCSCHTACA